MPIPRDQAIDLAARIIAESALADEWPSSPKERASTPPQRGLGGGPPKPVTLSCGCTAYPAPLCSSCGEATATVHLHGEAGTLALCRSCEAAGGPIASRREGSGAVPVSQRADPPAEGPTPPPATLPPGMIPDVAERFRNIDL